MSKQQAKPVQQNLKKKHEYVKLQKPVRTHMYIIHLPICLYFRLCDTLKRYASLHLVSSTDITFILLKQYCDKERHLVFSSTMIFGSYVSGGKAVNIFFLSSAVLMVHLDTSSAYCYQNYLILDPNVNTQNTAGKIQFK